MRTYIGLDGNEYSSVDEVNKANRLIKEHPLYVKEMRRRAIMNIPGEITREQWGKISGGVEVKKVKHEVNSEVKKVNSEVRKKGYNFQISDLHKSLLKSANRRGIPFDLNQEQIDSLMEKKCYFCGHPSETVITLGDRFEYKDSKGVCGMCKQAHDLFGPELISWLDRFVQ